MSDDLTDEELGRAETPHWSGRTSVDEWCRRLVAEVRRWRKMRDQRLVGPINVSVVHPNPETIVENVRKAIMSFVGTAISPRCSGTTPSGRPCDNDGRYFSKIHDTYLCGLCSLDDPSAVRISDLKNNKK